MDLHLALLLVEEVALALQLLLALLECVTLLSHLSLHVLNQSVLLLDSLEQTL